MKYIVFKVCDYDIERVFLFDRDIKHSDFAEPWIKQGYKPVRAGFVCLNDNGKVKCFGDSFSLGITSDREKDAKLVHQKLEV